MVHSNKKCTLRLHLRNGDLLLLLRLVFLLEPEGPLAGNRTPVGAFLGRALLKTAATYEEVQAGEPNNRQCTDDRPNDGAHDVLVTSASGAGRDGSSGGKGSSRSEGAAYRSE